MKKDRKTKRRLQLNKLTKQERAMKEAKKAAFAHPVDSARVLMASEGTATKAPLNKRLIALVLAIVMVLGLIPAGIFMLKPKAETTDLDAVQMTVRVNNDYYGTVNIPAGQIKDNIGGVTSTLTLPEGCTFERAVMEDTNKIPATVSTIAAVGAYNDNVYYSLDADTNTGTLLANKQNLVLLYSNTYSVTKNATNGTVDCDDELRHGNSLHVTLTPALDHSVSASDVTYTIGGTDYHPTTLNNNSFTISAAEIVDDITITVNFPAIDEYTIQDAHKIANADSKYYNLYGVEGHGGITQGRGQSAVGNPSDNDRKVFTDYDSRPLNSTNEQRYNPKYMNRTLDSLDFSVDSNYPNLYQTLGYTNVETNSNGVITDVKPNNAGAGQPAEFLLYSQSWSGNTSWILDSLSINGEYINYPSATEIADANNKPTATTTLRKGNMAGATVTVTLDEMGEGLYWKSLNSSGGYDPDVTYKRSSSSKRTYSYNGRSRELQAWQLNSHAKKRTYYKITISAVHDNLEVAYNFKDSSERTIVITDLEGIESAFAAQEHRRGLSLNPYERFYSVPVDSNNNLNLDAHNEYPAYYQERHSNLLRIPSNNLYLYQVKPGYNPYTVKATAKYYHTDGSAPTEIESTNPNQHLMLGGGGNLPGVVIKNSSQEGLEVVDEDWDSDLQDFVSVLYDYNSNLRYWGNSNSDGTTYGLARTTTSNQMDAETLDTNIPLLLESIKNYENAVKETKPNYRFYAIALLENESMTQELKLEASPYEYKVLFDLDGGSYENVPNGLVSTSTTGVYARGNNNEATIYTLENGATSTNMPKGEQPSKDNCVFLGWRLYKDGVAVTDEGYNKTYASNEVFAIDEYSIQYADYRMNTERNVPENTGHTFTFKAEWMDKAQSNDYANVNVKALRQTTPNADSYDTYYDEEETQLVGDTVLLNLHDSKAELGNGTYDSKYYTLNTEKSVLATEIRKNADNELIATYDLALCDLDVTKKVVGSPKTLKEFPITVVLKRDADSPIDFATAKSIITPSISTVTPVEDDTEETLTYTYNYKRSQSLTFADVPYGWTVTVSEPIAQAKPNGQDGELDYTTTIASVPATAGSQTDPQDGDTATVWTGTLTRDTAVTVTNKSESFLDLTKTLDYGENGTYDLRLTAYANGSIAKEAEIITEQVPTDYVLVVDQSGSMAEKDMPTVYSNLPETSNWVISQDETEPTARYINVPDESGDNFYRVYRKRGYMYEYQPRNTIYSGDIAGDNLGWFMREETVEQGVASEYFYNPYLDGVSDDDNQYRFYPIRISIKGEELFYAVKLQYDEDNNGVKTNKTLNPPANPWYKNYTSITGWNDYSPNSFGYNTVNNLVQGWSNRFASFGEGTFLTYGQVAGQKAGMYVYQELYKRHVGFNQLCYKDKYGVEHVLIDATFCDANGTPVGGSCDANNNGQPSEGKTSNTQAYWNGPLYTDDVNAREPRLVALQRSLEQFVTDISNQTDGNDVKLDHRIAIVGFSSDNSTYKNNEILSGVTVTDRTISNSSFYSLDEPNHKTGHDGPQYSHTQGNVTITDDDYRSALVYTNNAENVNSLINATTYITAYGGTEPELGFEMAQNILEKRTVKTYTNSQGKEKERNTVIIFFTDGRPGSGDYANQYVAANKVVNAAGNIKSSNAITSTGQAGQTQIYTVGLFGEADGNPLTYTNDIYSSYGEEQSASNSAAADQAARTYTFGHINELYDLTATYVNGFVRWDQTGNYAEYFDYSKRDTGFLNKTYYSKARQLLHYLYRKSFAGEYGYPAQQNDTIADYMATVSSEYPDAIDFDPTVNNGETYEEACDRVRGSSIKQERLNRYYYNATSGTDLDRIFEEIAETIPGSNVNITLDAQNAVLRDVINGDDFVIPENASDLTIRAWTEECTVSKNNEGAEIIPDADSDAWTKVDDISNDDIHYSNGVIDVQGFDYATNFVGYDNTDHKGQRIVVEIEGLVPKKDVVGELESNKDTSGVYKLTDSDEVLLDAFDVPNLYRYAYRLQEVGVITDDEFDIPIVKNSAPAGILVPYDEDGRSTSPLTFGDNTSLVWEDAKSGDVLFFESKEDDRVELNATIPDDGLNVTDYTYQVFWENEGDHGLNNQFAMYKPNQNIEDSTILVRNITNYRDLTIDLSVDDSPYVAPGYDFTVDVTLTGSNLNDADKIAALNNVNAGTGVTFVADGSKLKATITMELKNDGSIDPIQFKVPDGVEVRVDHSDYFYTTDEPFTYKDESFGDEDDPVAYTPHEITQATTIYIHDTVKDIIESGVLEETGGSHVILYILAGMAVISGGAGAAYVYRKKDEFVEK